jgi:hypothetical protein
LPSCIRMPANSCARCATLLTPLRLPEVLAAAQPEVFGLLDADSLPARLIARIDEQGCNTF